MASVVYLHYGVATTVPVQLSERDPPGGFANLTGKQVFANLQPQAGGTLVQRAAVVTDANAGQAEWSVLASDFGSALSGLLFLGPWWLWWTVVPSASPGRYPEGLYDTCWVVA